MGHKTMTLQSMLDMRLGILVKLICSQSDEKFPKLMYTQCIYIYIYIYIHMRIAQLGLLHARLQGLKQ